MEEPTTHPITWSTLSQPFITPISTSVQPKSNFYDGTTDWATWASKRLISHEDWSASNTEVTKSLYTSTCNLTTYPFVQHTSLENRDKGHLQAKEAQRSRMLTATLRKMKLFPGQCITVDYYSCSTKGRLFTSRGKTKDTDMYTGGALFMDMSSK